MTTLETNPYFLASLEALGRIPFTATSKEEALTRIAHLGGKILQSSACTVALVDLETRTLTTTVCVCDDPAVADWLLGKKSGITSAGGWLNYDLLLRKRMIERYNLDRDGQGVANPKTASRLHLSSLLSYPIQSQGRVLGFLNHFSSANRQFSEREKELLVSLANHAGLAADRFDSQRRFKQSLEILNKLSPRLGESSREFLQRVCQTACHLLDVSVCMVWRPDNNHEILKVVAATSAVDADYRKIELPISVVEDHLVSRRVAFLSDARRKHRCHDHNREVAARGWVSLLTAPMWGEDRLIGMLDVYSRYPREFSAWEKELFGTLANHAALSIQRSEELIRRERFQRLSQINNEMSQRHDLASLLEVIKRRISELVCVQRGWISYLDPRTGRLEIAETLGEELPDRRALELGIGITGKALEQGKSIRVDDVRCEPWRSTYEEFWKDTRSELAVPMLVKRARIRKGREISVADKPIGVLNLESSEVAAFSSVEEELIQLAVEHAARFIERFESDRKAQEVARIEKELLAQKDWDDIFRIVLGAIMETLGYDYVNVSLVVAELNLIRTEYIRGIPEEDVAEFKRMACHSLDSDDIQADIVRHGEIEVPSAEDDRLDRKIVKRFDHQDLVRVFVPMKSTDGRVIGTVEAGYRGKNRKVIYESDVQVLQEFVSFAARALEQWRRGVLDRMSHEFRQPLVGIRSNASFLQRRIKELSDEIIQRKLDDMLLDCDILLHQVEELEYVLGRAPRPAKIERTLVIRDVIIKTIKQLKPLVLEAGLDPNQIYYREKDIPRVILYLDRAKLNQAVFNLLNNSIKYAEEDPNQFGIRIWVEETRDDFILKFRDHGIGIRCGLGEKIFENGFRAPEAMAKNISGSGLGLTIARKAVRELGGDLLLARMRKPTEFHLILPRRLKEAPGDDPDDRR